MWENIKKLNNLIPEKLRLGILQLIILMFFLMLFELFILQNLFIIINYFSSPDLELSNSLINYLKQINTGETSIFRHYNAHESLNLEENDNPTEWPSETQEQLLVI